MGLKAPVEPYKNLGTVVDDYSAQRPFSVARGIARTHAPTVCMQGYSR